MSEITLVDPKEGYEAAKDPNCIFCLDQGFVRVVDVMGDDSSIVQAARVSYGKGTKSLRADRALIFYLMQNCHTTPFEMVEFKFHCKLPLFVARQWIRHRTANVNEMSGRYSVMEDIFWKPKEEDLRLQASTDRQGSSEEHLKGTEAQEILDEFQKDQKELYEHYQKYLFTGIAREVARTNLPLSIYTEWYWKIDLWNLLHFLELRMDTHAQKEIRLYAEAMAQFVKKRCPIAWEAFEEHVREVVRFSKSEFQILSEILKDQNSWSEIEAKRKEQLKKGEASEARIQRELAELKKRLKF